MSDLRKKLLEAKIASFERTGKLSALSGAMDDAYLTAEAGVLSNLWNTLFLLSIPKEERQLRVNMISYAKESRKNLRDIELKVLNKDLEGAIFAYHDFATNFLGAFVSDFEKLKNLENHRLAKQLTAPRPSAPKPPSEPAEPADEQIGDVIPPSGEGETEYEESPPASSQKKLEKAPDLEQLKNELTKRLVALDSAKSQVKKYSPESPAAAEIEARYNSINKKLLSLDSLEAAQALKHEMHGLGQLIRGELSKIEKSASYAIDDDIRKVSQHAIQRWLKRKLLNMNRSMRDTIYYNIVQDIIDLDPMFQEINANLKDKNKHMRDFEGDVKSIVSKIQSVNARLLALTKNIRATQKKPDIKREVLTNLKDLDRQLKGVFPQDDDSEE